MEVAALGLSVDSAGVVKGADELDRFTKAANDAGTAADRVGQDSKRGSDGVKRLGDEAKKTETAFGGFARQARALGGALAAALSVRAIATAADAWSDMQSRVGAAVKDMEAAPQLMQRMVDIANASYSPLSQTVEIYSRNVTVLAEMGRTADEAADFTEALNNALVITATRGERAASVQNALSKAMAVGRIDAQGLETVLANGGAVAEALASELGTTVNGLRDMATQGKITGNVIANALIGQFDELRARAEEMPATMEDGVVRIKNNFIQLIGTLDQTYGVSERVAEALLWVADNLKEIAALTAIVGTAWVTYRAGVLAAAAAQAVMNTQLGIAIGFIKIAYREFGILTAIHATLAGAISGVTAALRVLTVAMLTNPFTAAFAIITSVIAALYAFRDAQISVGDETVRLGDIFLGVWELIKRGAEFAQTVFTEGWQAAFAQISPALAEVGAFFDRVFTYIGNIVRARINFIAGLFAGLAASIRAAFSGEDVIGAFRGAQGRDYVGGLTSSIGRGIAQLADLGRAARSASSATATVAAASNAAAAANGALAAATGAATAASKAKTEALSEEARELQRRNEQTERYIESLREEVAQIGLSDQALRAREVSKAIDIATTQDQIDTINELAAARENALAALEAEKRAEEQRNRTMEEALRHAQRVVGETRQAMADQVNAAREVVGGFFASWYDGLRNGMSIFKSFTDSVIGGLNRIIDRLLDNTINSFLDNLFSGSSSGGILGGLLGGIKFADGGAFGPSGVQRFAKGGAFTNTIVNTPTLFRFANGAALGEMGEAGPEAIMPLKRGPDGSLGVQLHGRAANNNNVNVNNNYNIGGVMTPEMILAAIRQGGEETMRTVQRQLPTIMQEYDRNGAVAV